MTPPDVSIVIVSRQRPAALLQCLRGVARLTYAAYEVIVVADPDGLAAVATLPFAGKIKTVAFDQPNISAARNRGIVQAAGSVVAFLDDDAVPEPRWLDHLTAPFADQGVAAVGGYVRGRNGISFQWRGRVVDETGRAIPVETHDIIPTRLMPPVGWAVKTEGTNMAVRRAILAQTGGFDPAFHFFLDETDLNMRLAKLGQATAIVPLAQVHHAYAASAIRRQDRAVRDLFQIAASTVVFLRKHCPADRHQEVLAAAFNEQRTRAVAQLVDGLQEPRDFRRLIQSWHKGIAEGQTRRLTNAVPLPEAQQPFLPFQTLWNHEYITLSGHWSKSAALRQAARKAAETGALVSLFLFSYSTAYHHIRFTQHGYWEQVGGLWGRSDRHTPVFQRWTPNKRVAYETNRIGSARFVTD